MAFAYFAGGCFWCITPIFEATPGVASVTAGYSGGEEISPSYELVKSQKTRHRETVRVEYDEGLVPYTELLDIYLSAVDPYDPDGQFIDRGHSYTLAVYYTCQEEKKAAKDAITKLQESAGRQAFVSVEPFLRFYTAEEEHQNYHRKNPEAFQKELISSGRKPRG